MATPPDLSRALLAALRASPPSARPAELRVVRFADGVAKARWLDARARVDALAPGPRVQALAAVLRGVPDLRARAVALHAFIRDRIRYVRDPDGEEELADAETILGRLLDDCDGKATAFVTVALCVGLDARVRGVFNARGDFYHVQAEVRWPGSASFPGAAPDGWVLAELICEGVQLGQGVEHARRDDAGRVVTTDP